VNPRTLALRPAYTLLEVILATTIAVLLLGALYVAVEIHLGYAQTGRDVVARSALGRALVARMVSDITPSLPPYEPSRFRSSSSSSSPSSSSSSPSSSSSSSGGQSSSGSGQQQQQPATESAALDPNTSVLFNLGVQGDATTLTLYVSRLPRELNTLPPEGEEERPALSDLRRITYWLAGGPDAPLGLARQEVKIATSDEAQDLALPEGADEANFILAEEVRSLAFRYWDGQSWLDTWDGTAAGSDGTTPIGPPLAIAIEIGVAPTSARGRPVADADLTYYRHTVAIPTANGASGLTTGGTLP
jgi:hypothetical protein